MNKNDNDIERRRRMRRLSTKILSVVCPAIGIDEDPSNLDYGGSVFDGLFPDARIFIIRNAGERSGLPFGRYMYCSYNAANVETPFAELTPRNSALSELLASNWAELPSLPTTELTDFILTIQLVGNSVHKVLGDTTDLETFSKSNNLFGPYILNDAGRRIAERAIFSTTMHKTNDGLFINAVTLFGWMHKIQNLGITQITIARDGSLAISDRETICDPVFSEIPDLTY